MDSPAFVEDIVGEPEVELIDARNGSWGQDVSEVGGCLGIGSGIDRQSFGEGLGRHFGL